MSRFVLLLCCLLFAVEAAAKKVVVFAAASLSEALTEAVRPWEKRTGHRVVFNFAGSSTLGTQIIHGAPAHLFLSADEATMKRVEAAGRIRRGTRSAFLGNTLVVVVPARSAARITAAAGLLDPSLKRIALGDPATVPAGLYAREWLRSQGVWDQLKRKVVPSASVRAALAAVEAGNADAAVVYRTDALVSRKVRVALHVAGGQAPRIRYSFAAVSGDRDAAALLQYLQSEPARNVFRRFGFLVE